MLYHMASMARCGETVLLRCLNAHPEIYAIGEGFKQIDRSKFDILDRASLTYVVKQGVWEEKEPFKGFVLVRNPVSVYISLMGFAGPDADDEGVNGRLVRWMKDIDPDVRLNSKFIVNNFCTFYNRRFGALADLPLTTIDYESFVTDPEAILKMLCELVFDIEFDPVMLTSHEQYKPGKILHAGNRADLPIHKNSLNRWGELADHVVERIIDRTEQTWKRYGYTLRG